MTGCSLSPTQGDTRKWELSPYHLPHGPLRFLQYPLEGARVQPARGEARGASTQPAQQLTGLHVYFELYRSTYGNKRSQFKSAYLSYREHGFRARLL